MPHLSGLGASTPSPERGKALRLPFEPTATGKAAYASHLKRWALRPMRSAALAAIQFYQRYVSPFKGFCCAYRQHTGRASCSALGYRAVRRFGVLSGLALVRERTSRCGIAHRRFTLHSRPSLHAQQGVCDVGCDLPCDANCDLPCHSGCELPSGRTFSNVCNYFSCCDCGSCDWPSRRRKSSAEEKYVYIPPAQSRNPL